MVVVTIVMDSGNIRKPIYFAKTTFGSGEHPLPKIIKYCKKESSIIFNNCTFVYT